MSTDNEEVHVLYYEELQMQNEQRVAGAKEEALWLSPESAEAHLLLYEGPQI